MKETLEMVQKNFDETFRLLHDWATKNNIKLEDLQNNIDEAEIKRREKNRRNARTNETSKIAFDYRQNVSDLFRKNKALIDAALTQDPRSNSQELTYAIDTINWYLTQLPVKITRAYVGLVESNPEDSDPIQNDYNGSAKVVLLGVENSFPAWEIILKHLPELEDDCWKFLVMLDKIRKRILVDFPNATEFVRPGFDEVAC